jgi:hypothetical protein
MGDWTDPFFKLRYGVPAGEKYRQAIAGEIPGAQPIGSEEDVEREERRASGYLFAKEHPAVSGVVQPIVDNIRTNIFRDSPKVVAAARQGQEAAGVKPGLGSKLARAAIMPGFTTWEEAAAGLFGKR